MNRMKPLHLGRSLQVVSPSLAAADSGYHFGLKFGIVISCTTKRAITKPAENVVKLTASHTIKFLLLAFLRYVECWFFTLLPSGISDCVHVNFNLLVVIGLKRFVQNITVMFDIVTLRFGKKLVGRGPNSTIRANARPRAATPVSVATRTIVAKIPLAI